MVYTLIALWHRTFCCDKLSLPCALHIQWCRTNNKFWRTLNKLFILVCKAKYAETEVEFQCKPVTDVLMKTNFIHLIFWITLKALALLTCGDSRFKKSKYCMYTSSFKLDTIWAWSSHCWSNCHLAVFSLSRICTIWTYFFSSSSFSDCNSAKLNKKELQ